MFATYDKKTLKLYPTVAVKQAESSTWCHNKQILFLK